MKTQCCKSFVSKLFFFLIGWTYPRTARYGKNGKNTFVGFFNYLFTRLHAEQNFCFRVDNCQRADQKQLTRRWAFDLDIESTHDQPASCRARPTNVDDGLKDIGWIRGLGGGRLPAASYSLLPNLKKRSIFCHGRGIDIFCRLFSTRQRPSVFVSDAWPALAICHRRFELIIWLTLSEAAPSASKNRLSKWVAHIQYWVYSSDIRV